LRVRRRRRSVRGARRAAAMAVILSH
jgi:hypothetical protein